MPSNDEKLKRLQNILSVMEGSLSRDEFLEGFKNLTEFLKKAQENLSKQIEKQLNEAENRHKELEELSKNTLRKLEEDGASNFSNLKRWVLEQVGEYLISSRLDQKLAAVDNRLKELNSYRPPDTSSIALQASKLVQQELLPLIPTVEKVEEKLPEILPEILPKFGTSIRDGLELLHEDERLDVSAIKGLEEKIEELRKLISTTKPVVFGGGGTAGGGRIVKSYDLSSQLDGVTKVFSLPAMWRIISIQSSSFPNAFRPTIDYTYDAGAHTLTFTSEIEASTTLAQGQTIIIIYSE